MYLKSDFGKILSIFVLWRSFLFLCLWFSFKFVPLGYKDRFLAGGYENYTSYPYLLPWANFDGEHYLAIANVGYKGLEHAFFPVYPLLMSILISPFNIPQELQLIPLTIAGLVVSNLCFLFALYFLFKLVKRDFSKQIAYLTIFILLTFPTSFFLGSLYTESLFLLLAVLSFWYAVSKQWFLATLFGLISSATRIFGILLLPAFLLDVYKQKTEVKKWFWILLIPLGLIVYMAYQGKLTGDPFAFYKSQKLVGEQHESTFTLLPQVYYRYLKMLLTTPLQNPIYQTIFMEAVVGIAFFLLPIIGYFKKMKYSYLFFAMAGFLSPSIQGSFSSVPRYILVFFPSFIILALILHKAPKYAKVLYFIVSTIFLALETILFLRGYWVA